MKSIQFIGVIILSAWLLAVPAFAQGEPDPFDCTARDEVDLAVCIYQVFPQIAVGGGFSGELVVTNQGYVEDAQVRIDFWGDDGQPLMVDLGQQQPAGQIIFSLGAGHSRVVPVSLDSEVAIPGYARITHSAEISLRGSYVLRVLDAQGELQTQLGVSSLIPLNSFSFPVQVDSQAGVNTGLALANGSFRLIATPDPAPQGFVLTLIDEQGMIVDQQVLQLDLDGHTSLFVDDERLFPGLNDFRGVLSVSAGIDFGLTALRLEQGILSTIAVSEGPVFSSFDITSSLDAVPEQEPNDTLETAGDLQLPARVSGVVTPVQDTDLFSFQASQGDILTVYTQTERGVSRLDSFLSLETPSGELLAFNDLNRLLRRFDSFLQVVLPDDGEYVLRVEDFALQGGPAFTYDLVVSLQEAQQP
ncbi:MAG TPA: hypothetical protein VLU25_19420 [Acidobacteriota bacterium]|nr:hypothetical protein [Acidobacteriota bacterium]